MALNLPTADPATLYYRPLSNGRVVIVANSDLSWSVAAAQRYARVKGIPLGNIVSVAMGTDRKQWTPANDTAMRAALITPLRAKLDSVLAQCVLVAPGVPQSTRLDSTCDLAVVSLGVPGYVATLYLCYCARHIDDQIAALGITCLIGYTGASSIGTFVVYLVAPPVLPFEFFGNGDLQYRLGATNILAPLDPLYGTAYEGLNSEVVKIPTQLGIDSVGLSTARCLPYGRIGTAWTSQVFTFEEPGNEIPSRFWENEERGPRLARQCAEFSAAPAPANRYRYPIHLQLSDSYLGYSSLAYLHWQLRGWGYNSTYAWRSSNSPGTEAYAPAAGTAYTLAQLQAGQIRDYPYHLMLGDASNTEMMKEPFVTAWQPTSGGGSLLGPSEGWQYQVNGLERGGAGGSSNMLHPQTAIYVEMYSVAHLLLRGATWAEASYYPGQIFPLYSVPSGDPLARPFPR